MLCSGLVMAETRRECLVVMELDRGGRAGRSRPCLDVDGEERRPGKGSWRPWKAEHGAGGGWAALDLTPPDWLQNIPSSRSTHSRSLGPVMEMAPTMSTSQCLGPGNGLPDMAKGTLKK